MRVGVIGGRGFLGRAIVDELGLNGIDTVVPSRAELDLARVTEVPPALTDVSHIIFAAGVLLGRGPDSVTEDPAQIEAAMEVNIRSLDRLAVFARVRRIRVIHISSYVYARDVVQPTPEDSPRGRRGLYATMKLIAESVVDSAVRQGLDAVILRPFNAYGNEQPDTFVIPRVIRAAALDRPVTLESLLPRRDFIHVRDVARAVVATLSRGPSGGVYNIGSGAATSVGEVVDLVSSLIGKPLNVRILDTSRLDAPDSTCADVTAAGRDLGWSPVISLNAGLTEMLERARLATGVRL